MISPPLMLGMTYILKYNHVMHEFINVPTSLDVRDGSGESERDKTMHEEPKVFSSFAFLAFYREVEGKIFIPSLCGTYIKKKSLEITKDPKHSQRSFKCFPVFLLKLEWGAK
jgi:hypothetical protein